MGAAENQVAVDLIGDHQDVVLQAQLHHPRQLFPAPHLAQRVVGGAEDEQLGLLELSFKVGPVHLPMAGRRLQQLIGQHGAPLKVRHFRKLRVDRRLDEDVVLRFRENAHQRRQRRNYAQRVAAKGRVRAPTVAAGLPGAGGLKVAGRAGGVAEQALPGPGRHGVQNRLGRGQIHVGNPQGDHLVRAEDPHALFVLGGMMPRTVHRGIKIIVHRKSPPCQFSIIISRPGRNAKGKFPGPTAAARLCQSRTGRPAQQEAESS